MRKRSNEGKPWLSFIKRRMSTKRAIIAHAICQKVARSKYAVAIVLNQRKLVFNEP